jgi:alpha-L-fucosidase
MSELALPTPAHLAWAECEVGVIVHHDVQVYEPDYSFRRQWGYSPSPAVFAPTALDTDQWISTAAEAGAKYAVLVAKHCSGFSLWPTGAHDYSVASSPWRGGHGDVVADFFASCARYGLQPGLYASSSCNAYLNVDNPGQPRTGGAEAQARYNAAVLQQLTELWTRYGEVFEIWFDGGTLAPELGGPDIAALLAELQPRAVVFQGPPTCDHLLRWVGNERGEAPEPCWSTTNHLTESDGTIERLAFGIGDPDGRWWAPAESDMPNRDQRKAFQGGWFWRAGDDEYLYSVEHLLERYDLSVGRNSNLLLGMVVDNRGLVPDADCRQFAQFGREVRRRFAQPLASASGRGSGVELALPAPQVIDHVVLSEDQSGGHRIRAWEIEARTPQGSCVLATGSAVGHKQIVRLAPVEVAHLTLRVTSAVGEPLVREVAAYRAG